MIVAFSSKPSICHIAVGFGFLLPAFSSPAIIYQDSRSDSDAVAAATNSIFAGRTLWVRGTLQGNPTNFYTCGTYLDQWNVLMAAHQQNIIGLPATYTKVGNGLNFSTNPGATAEIADIVIAPGYNSDGSTWDLAIAHLKTPLPIPPGLTNSLLLPLSFTDVSEFQQLWVAGCGVWGSVSGPLNIPDGNFRAGTGPVDLDAHGFSQAYFFVAEFLAGSGPPFGPQNVKGGQLDSASTWFDTNGNPVGMSIAINTGYTIIERFANSDIQNWINANRIFPPSLSISTAGTNVVLSWTNSAYSLQSATNAAGIYSDVAGATNPYTNAMTSSQQFFRLKSQ